MKSFTYQAGAGNVKASVEIRTPQGGVETVAYSVHAGEGPAFKVGGTDEAKALIVSLQAAVDRADDYRRVVTGGARSTDRGYVPGRP